MKKAILKSLALSIFKLRLSRLSWVNQFNQFDLWIERLIIEELSKRNFLGKQNVVYSKKLVLNLSLNNSCTKRECLKLLMLILKTRGRLRWLCLRLLPSLFNDSYELTRLQLILRIFRNWNQFVHTVLSKVIIVEDFGQNFASIEVYEFTHPDIGFSFSEMKTYVLGDEISQKMEFSDNEVSEKSDVIVLMLEKLLRWDSGKVINFARESKSLLNDSSVLEYLQFFPDVISKIHASARLSIEFHQNSDLSFDDICDLNQLLPEVLNKVEIWNQRFIVRENVWHIIDSTCSPYGSFVAGHWQFMEQIPASLSHVYLQKPLAKRVKNLNQAIFLIGRADENWYHFLLDTLPRYLFLNTLDRDIPVLLRADLPKTSIALMERLLDRKIIYVRPEDRISVKTLYFVAARGTVYDSKPPNREEQVKFSPRVLKMQRDWMLRQLSQTNGKVYPPEIFLPRRAKYRNLLNSNAVSNCLIQNDFKVIELEKDFFLEQHQYFSKAKTIIAPGGAVLANILFMGKGSKVIAIRSWRGSNLRLWANLADACKVDYSEVIGIPTYFGSKSLAREHSNYYLPLRRIKKALKS
jgi:hypothetical protein